VLSTDLTCVVCAGRRGKVPPEVRDASRIRRRGAPGRDIGGATREIPEARRRDAVEADTAFAKYHNDVQEMQAKSDDLVRKNKSLRNKNKGTPLSC
jgi:hypothetical protein